MGGDVPAHALLRGVRLRAVGQGRYQPARNRCGPAAASGAAARGREPSRARAAARPGGLGHRSGGLGPRMSRDDVLDVVVIGAGPSGAVVTHTLATQGFRVMCLEQGDWVNPTDFPANHPEWELLCQSSWHHDPNVRRLPADYPIDVSE